MAQIVRVTWLLELTLVMDLSFSRDEYTSYTNTSCITVFCDLMKYDWDNRFTLRTWLLSPKQLAEEHGEVMNGTAAGPYI